MSFDYILIKNTWIGRPYNGMKGFEAISFHFKIQMCILWSPLPSLLHLYIVKRDLPHLKYCRLLVLPGHPLLRRIFSTDKL